MPATKKLKVSVTADDIEHGTGGDCQNCPIARAMHRALLAIGYNDTNRFVVEIAYSPSAAVTPRGETLVNLSPRELPPGAAKFVADFDMWDYSKSFESDQQYLDETRNDSVPLRPEPFEFELELPEAKDAND